MEKYEKINIGVSLECFRSLRNKVANNICQTKYVEKLLCEYLVTKPIGIMCAKYCAPELVDSDEILTVSDLECAEIMNGYFCEMFITECPVKYSTFSK